ncbi:MAG: SRPBCC domain-containing protein [Pseudomonadota bacterium]
MSESEAEGQEADLVLEYELDAPPQKVWRAISIPEFREKWLPESELVDAEPVSSEPGEEISYRMKDDEPPFLESKVTFQVRPNEDGSTVLRIIHSVVDERLARQHPSAANSNWPCLMRAA